MFPPMFPISNPKIQATVAPNEVPQGRRIDGRPQHGRVVRAQHLAGGLASEEVLHQATEARDPGGTAHQHHVHGVPGGFFGKMEEFHYGNSNIMGWCRWKFIL